VAKTTQLAESNCLFRGRVNSQVQFRVKITDYPKLCNPNAKVPAKSKHWNNFRDRGKNSRNIQYKIGVGESNGDIISAAALHLAINTTSGAF
jgi:hypothetical protein